MDAMPLTTTLLPPTTLLRPLVPLYLLVVHSCHFFEFADRRQSPFTGQLTTGWFYSTSITTSRSITPVLTNHLPRFDARISPSSLFGTMAYNISVANLIPLTRAYAVQDIFNLASEKLGFKLMMLKSFVPVEIFSEMEAMHLNKAAFIIYDVLVKILGGYVYIVGSTSVARA